MKILFGEAVAGIYALVNRVMGAPSQLIAGATGEVYRQKASSDYNQEGNCYSLFLKTFKKEKFKIINTKINNKTKKQSNNNIIKFNCVGVRCWIRRRNNF